MLVNMIRWFQQNGFPGADREGIAPGVIVVSKQPTNRERAERAVGGWLAETETQRQAAGADVALLVVRRDGTADVGEWWCFMEAWRFECLCNRSGKWAYGARFPLRLLVRDAALLLRYAGYGSPLDEEATA